MILDRMTIKVVSHPTAMQATQDAKPGHGLISTFRSSPPLLPQELLHHRRFRDILFGFESRVP